MCPQKWNASASCGRTDAAAAPPAASARRRPARRGSRGGGRGGDGLEEVAAIRHGRATGAALRGSDDALELRQVVEGALRPNGSVEIDRHRVRFPGTRSASHAWASACWSKTRTAPRVAGDHGDGRLQIATDPATCGREHGERDSGLVSDGEALHDGRDRPSSGPSERSSSARTARPAGAAGLSRAPGRPPRPPGPRRRTARRRGRVRARPTWKARPRTAMGVLRARRPARCSGRCRRARRARATRSTDRARPSVPSRSRIRERRRSRTAELRRPALKRGTLQRPRRPGPLDDDGGSEHQPPEGGSRAPNVSSERAEARGGPASAVRRLRARLRAGCAERARARGHPAAPAGRLCRGPGLMSAGRDSTGSHLPRRASPPATDRRRTAPAPHPRTPPRRCARPPVGEHLAEEDESLLDEPLR